VALPAPESCDARRSLQTAGVFLQPRGDRPGECRGLSSLPRGETRNPSKDALTGSIVCSKVDDTHS
jgi:hypothetical protein